MEVMALGSSQVPPVPLREARQLSTQISPRPPFANPTLEVSAEPLTFLNQLIITFAEIMDDGVKVRPLMPGSMGLNAPLGAMRIDHMPKVMSSSSSSCAFEYLDTPTPMPSAVNIIFHLGRPV